MVRSAHRHSWTTKNLGSSRGKPSGPVLLSTVSPKRPVPRKGSRGQESRAAGKPGRLVRIYHIDTNEEDRKHQAVQDSRRPGIIRGESGWEFCGACAICSSPAAGERIGLCCRFSILTCGNVHTEVRPKRNFFLVTTSIERVLGGCSV